MRKLTHAETFLLRNWRDTERLEASAAAVRSWTYDSVIETLASRPWWTKQFRVERFPSRGEATTAIHVLKANWQAGASKWQWYTLGLQDLNPPALLGLADPPMLYVWNPTWRMASAFDRAFVPAAKRICKPLALWDEEDASVGGYVRRTPEQWLRLLEVGRFAEEVCSEFDKLARLIAPIDRALAKVRARAAGKRC
jgi:hypothetical protein